ncbi:unnamed protein product [Ixodes persulcatus]
MPLGMLFTAMNIGRWSLKSQPMTPAFIHSDEQFEINKSISVCDWQVTRVGLVTTFVQPPEEINKSNVFLATVSTVISMLKSPPQTTVHFSSLTNSKNDSKKSKNTSKLPFGGRYITTKIFELLRMHSTS